MRLENDMRNNRAKTATNGVKNLTEYWSKLYDDLMVFTLHLRNANVSDEPVSPRGKFSRFPAGYRAENQLLQQQIGALPKVSHALRCSKVNLHD